MKIELTIQGVIFVYLGYELKTKVVACFEFLLVFQCADDSLEIAIFFCFVFGFI